MIFKCKSSTFGASLKRVESALSQNPVQDILRGILLTADNGVLTITATDLDVGVHSTIEECEITEDGTAVIQAHLLKDLVKHANGVLSFAINGGKCHIKTKTTKWDLCVLDASKYPAAPYFDDELETVELSREQLTSVISKVRMSVSSDLSRVEMAQICARNGKIMSGDGHRATVVSNVDFNVSIPLMAISVFIKILNLSSEDTVSLQEQDNFVVCSVGDDVYFFRKSSSAFLNLENLLLGSLDKIKGKFAVKKIDIVGALNRVGVTSDEGSGVLLECKDKQTLVIKSSDKTNSSEEKIKIKSNSNFKLGVSYVYLLEGLKFITEKVVKVGFGTNPSDPILVSEGDYQSIIIPRRVDI